jgi:chaperonin GroEL
MKRGMDKALKIVLGFLKDISMPISQPEELRNVCMVSSNHDEKIASIVSSVLDAVGIEGVMNIVESPTGISDFRLVNGLIFNRGLVNTNLVQELAGGNMTE